MDVVWLLIDRNYLDRLLKGHQYLDRLWMGGKTKTQAQTQTQAQRQRQPTERDAIGGGHSCETG